MKNISLINVGKLFIAGSIAVAAPGFALPHSQDDENMRHLEHFFDAQAVQLAESGGTCNDVLKPKPRSLA